MAYKVFFSYQSDIKEYCEKFITSCLKAAIKEIEEYEIEMDFGMRNTAGNPPLLSEMLRKAEFADIVISDLTFIAATDKGKRIPNPNVLLETGHAWNLHGYDSTIFVINEAYGKPDELPVDLKGIRWPITYNLDIVNYEDEHLTQAKKLKDDLKNALRTSINTLQQKEQTRWSPFCILSGWINRDFKERYIDYSGYRDFEDEVLSVLTKKNESIRLSGPAKCGKSRFLYEFLNSNSIEAPIKNRILYFDASYSDGRLDPILDVLLKLRNHSQEKIIILDNISVKQHKEILTTLEGTKLSLISLGGVINDKDEDFTIKLWTNQLLFGLIDSINKNSYVHLNLLTSNVVDECDFDLEEVLVFLRNYNLKKFKISSGRIDYYSLRNEPLDLFLLKILSLFSYIETDEEIQNQLNKLILHFGLKIENVKIQIVSLKKRGLINQKGDYMIVSPFRLSRELAIEFWNENFVKTYPDFMLLVNENKLTRSFIKRTKELLDSGMIIEFVVELSKTSLSDYDHLNTEIGSMLLMEFASISPTDTLNAIEVAFFQKTTEELRSFKYGRRHIIWALEKHLFRKELFNRAAKILYRLALAENEDISNNAFGVFVHLFQINLPGTQATLVERKNFLIGIAENGINGILQRAFYVALRIDGFRRDVTQDEQLDEDPKDYDPDSTEIKEYQGSIIKLILDEWEKSNEEKLKKILFDNILGLYLIGNQDLINPFIIRLIEKEGLTNELFKDLVLIRNRFGNNVSEELKNKFDIITRSSNPIRNDLRMIVAFPPYRDVRNGENDYDHRFNSFVESLLDDTNFKWLGHIQVLLEGNQLNTFEFGMRIGKRDVKIDLIVDRCIQELIQIPKQNQNTNLIKGILRGKESISYTKQIISRFTAHNEIVDQAFELLLFSSIDLNDFKLLIEKSREYDLDLSNFLKLNPSTLSISDFKELCILLVQIFPVQGPSICLKYISFELFNKIVNIEDVNPILFEVTKNNPWLEKGDFSWYDNLSIVYMEWLIHNNNNNKSVVELIISQLFEACESYEFQNESYLRDLLEELINYHFEILFENIGQVIMSERKYNIKRVLISVFKSLAIWDNEKVLSWCRRTGGDGAIFFVKILPFGTHNSEGYEWNELYLSLMRNFYDTPYLLSEVSSVLHSYSVWGSAVPLYKYRQSLVRKLVEDPIDNIRIWAIKEVSYLENSIQRESRGDENHEIFYN